MAIETVEDIVEELMNKMGIYGACDDDLEDNEAPTCPAEKPCRVCASSDLRSRLDAAYQIEKILRSVQLMDRFTTS